MPPICALPARLAIRDHVAATKYRRFPLQNRSIPAIFVVQLRQRGGVKLSANWREGILLRVGKSQVRFEAVIEETPAAKGAFAAENIFTAARSSQVILARSFSGERNLWLRFCNPFILLPT
jgi:hypothetical protein